MAATTNRKFQYGGYGKAKTAAISATRGKSDIVSKNAQTPVSSIVRYTDDKGSHGRQDHQARAVKALCKEVLEFQTLWRLFT